MNWSWYELYVDRAVSSINLFLLLVTSVYYFKRLHIKVVVASRKATEVEERGILERKFMSKRGIITCINSCR